MLQEASCFLLTLTWSLSLLGAPLVLLPHHHKALRCRQWAHSIGETEGKRKDPPRRGRGQNAGAESYNPSNMRWPPWLQEWSKRVLRCWQRSWVSTSDWLNSSLEFHPEIHNSKLIISQYHMNETKDTERIINFRIRFEKFKGEALKLISFLQQSFLLIMFPILFTQK